MVHQQAARVPAARPRPRAVVMELPVVRRLAPHAVAERAPRLPAADAAAGGRN